MNLLIIHAEDGEILEILAQEKAESIQFVSSEEDVDWCALRTEYPRDLLND